ncbi:MAG TPA: hypothetical protein VHG35_04380 [Gemmatimonadales bacterium]|nr:hypothetical protein [Gemmatimonadales bacterium]
MIFLQSDYADTNPCGRQKFEAVWGPAGMQPLIQRIAERYAAVQDSSLTVDAQVFTLNANPGALASFTDLSPAWADGRQLRMPSSRDYAIEDITAELQTRHRGVLADAEQRNLQNVARGVLALVNGRSQFFGAGTRTVRVVFLSDMLHYNAGARDTDVERGRFNLADEYSRDLFAHAVSEGTLPPSMPLTDLGPDIRFEVYSVRVPRCTNEPWSGGTTPDFPEIYGAVDQIWYDVFTRLGADRVELGRTSVDGIVPVHVRR